ncbi:MAG: acetyl-CoA decarbonylase/synthase complex subunit delta [Candidatus Omnitrophica bacterium]|nr:acetyl-CoA decarbonylase/synthase complex subunit delta [Candidatus Omnitrophota bacterium]
MSFELLKEKWSNRINTVTIGATKDEGGSRTSVVKIGGESTLPFLFEEGEMPNKPAIAMEIWDTFPKEWPDLLKEPFLGVLDKPVEWAKRCVNEYKPDLLFIRLMSAHPEWGNNSPDRIAEVVKSIASNVGVPFIVKGCGDEEKDNMVLSKVSQILHGERCLLGNATQKNYRTLVASCIADGHSIISENPLDINIEKQMNILISDMDFSLERIIIYPTTTALGYGMEYVYSLMERSRMAGLSGDKLLAMPIMCFVGQEVWRVKEARGKVSDFPKWGEEEVRGPLWEATTAINFLQAGADIVVVCHPKSVEIIQGYLKEIMVNEKHR